MMPNIFNRFSINGNLYYQQASKSPVCIPLRCKRVMLSSEEVWRRSPPKPVTREWQKLDMGWVTECAICTIHNNSEWVEENPLQGCLELGYPNSTNLVVSTGLSIPPGLCTVIYPKIPMYIRCIEGESTYTISAISE